MVCLNLKHNIIYRHSSGFGHMNVIALLDGLKADREVEDFP